MKGRIARVWWLVFALITGFSSFVSAQTTPAPSNFFQIRFFYPFPTETGEFTSAITLDAAFKQQFEDFTLAFKLTDFNLVRQKASLEASGNFGFASLEFTGGTGSELGSRKNSLLLVGAFLLPKPSEGIQYFSDTTLVYYLESDSSAQSGYTVNSFDASVKGNFATNWRWSAGYALSSVFVPVINNSNLSQSLKAEVRGKLDVLDLSFGSSVRFQEGGPRYDIRLEGKYPFLETETLSAQVMWNSSNGDSESLSLASTRFDPLTVSLSLSRGSTAGISLALTGDYELDAKTNLSANYGISFGTSPDHDFGLQFSYREKQWNARAQSSLNFSFDVDKQLWFGRFGIRLQGTYKVAPFNFSTRINLDLRPNQKTFEINATGSLSSSASYSSDPWTISLDLGLIYNRDLSGTISTSVLYRILPNLSLNFSGNYRRTLSPAVIEQLSFGFGIRYLF
jgi:hypothetical protein